MADQELQERQHGDGRVFAPEGINSLLARNIPWQKKVYLAATSNGCYEPEALMGSWLTKLYGPLDKDNITEDQKEEAAYQAFVEYTLQNSLFDQLVAMASKKEDTGLLVDLLITPHAISPKEHIETTHVPQSFLEGHATGLATDEAFEIIEKISSLFYDPFTGRKFILMSDNTRTTIIDTLNILEDQVKISPTLDKLKENFLNALKPKQSEAKKEEVPVME